MNARTAFILSLFPLLLPKAAALENGNHSTPKHVTDRIIVQYKEKPTFANAMGFIKQGVTHGGFGVAAGKQKDILEMDASVAIEDAAILAKELEVDPQVNFAEPDFIMKTMQVPNDPRLNEQWHLLDQTGGGINILPAWDITTGRSDIIVGVIDTGILPHEDIINKLVPGYDFISNAWMANDGDRRDKNPLDNGDAVEAGECGYNADGSPDPENSKNSNWHGTHVSGTIAAETNNAIGVSGVTWHTRIMPLRAIGRCGGYASDIADAIRWATGLPVYRLPNNTNPVKVLNLSLGGFSKSCPRTYQQAINAAVNAGVTVVVAAGNENMNASDSTPANCNNVITVAAVNRSGSRSWYSNYGHVVDIAAPGGETRTINDGVLSTANAGTTTATEDSYEYYQGTSMATPHVAGIAALIYSINPDITPDRVEQIIKNSARVFPDDSCTHKLCGAGIIDAANTLNSTPTR